MWEGPWANRLGRGARRTPPPGCVWGFRPQSLPRYRRLCGCPSRGLSCARPYSVSGCVSRCSASRCLSVYPCPPPPRRRVPSRGAPRAAAAQRGAAPAEAAGPPARPAEPLLFRHPGGEPCVAPGTSRQPRALGLRLPAGPGAGCLGMPACQLRVSLGVVVSSGPGSRGRDASLGGRVCGPGHLC